MNNLVELKFEPIARNAYNVELRGGIEGKSPEVILTTKLPAFDPDRYRLYQQACRQLYDRHARIGLKSTSVITAEDLTQVRQNLDTSATNLLATLNRWGKSPQLAEIAQAIADRSENLRVTISTECTELRRLPFHQWQLFPPQTEAIFSGIAAKVLERTRHPDRIRLLVILGDATGIDIEADKRAIEDYCQSDAELVFLTQPNRAELTTTLADDLGWDIIFFSGHSSTENDTGRIYINATDSLTMAELKDVLKPAIEQRVQIAIFNSCDGLGITPVLEKLNIDRLIVMREPIPDLIAQEFLKSFLKAFTGGARFDDAVKLARQHLVNFEDKYPYVSWLPIVIQNRLVTSPTWQSLGKIRSPYKGLEAFTEADAANFYGREETIERYAKLVAQSPLVPIIGASGSGKSSLVQAGLIPHLKQDDGRDWQILTMRPGRNPFNALAKAISNGTDLQTIELDIELASDRQLLTQKLAQIRIPHHRILLFIDQFEESFTQSDDESARQVFLQSLADAVSNLPNFSLVFTLRNDFLPTLQSDRQDNDFRQFLERYSPQLVGSMSRDRLRATITKPVEKLGVEFEGGLVDRLLQDVGTADGSLPLLQLVLDLLWKNVQKRQLTHECYDAIGGQEGMKTVLVKLAEDVYDGFVKQGRVKEFKQVFLRLVTLGDSSTPDTRRIASRADIGETNWRRIVVPLAQQRLLKTDRETVEVIHEILIQSWQLLKGWIADYRQELERIAEIETAALKWHHRHRSKQELWGGRKLKDAKKFSRDRSRLLTLQPVANDFLRVSSKQQRWHIVWQRLVLILLGILVLWIVSGIMVVLNMGIVEDAFSRSSCDQSRFTPTIQLLKRIREKDLKYWDLSWRDLHCFNLRNTDFTGADLTGVDLAGVNLAGTYFTKAKLTGADLAGANFSGAIFNGADLAFANLVSADLKGANLANENLKGANLRLAKLDGAILKDADLTFASLDGAILNGADLAFANLKGVKLTSKQVKVAKNWQKAEYAPEMQKKLGLKYSDSFLKEFRQRTGRILKVEGK
jgi:uncharacterized protein YjbI with pentapeptide repeats/energy-coupling factor transporter ATP-binding protein EcfA2